jgi:hypothetical protein
MYTPEHIMVRRSGYYHHGIQVDAKAVIHFTGEPGSKSNAAILETSLEEFLNGGSKEIVAYGETLEPTDILENARARIGETGYNLIFNNCEHFAFWCMTGKHESDQVVKVAGTSSAAIGAGALTGGGLAAVSSAGTVVGLNAAGLMSGLGAIGFGGVVGGIVSLSVAPSVLANMVINRTLKDDENLTDEERSARKKAKVAAKTGTVVGTVGSVATISAVGTAAGLSGAGITSGLATIGSVVGGTMVAGTAIAIAAPAVVAMATGFGLYKILKK